FELEFANLVVVIAHREIGSFNETIQAAQSALRLKAVATFFQIFKVNFVWFDGNAVPPAIKRITKCQPTTAGEPARAAADVTASRVGIQNRAEWRAIVVCVERSAVTEKQKVLHAIFETRAAACLPVVCATERRYVT